MRNIYLLCLALLLWSCSKEENITHNQTGIATFIFSPGGAESQVSYYSFTESRQILETKYALYQIREAVKIGDEIKLGMQTFGNPVGNFEIRLLINNNLIRTVKVNGSDKTLYLTHKVTLDDLNAIDAKENGSTTTDHYYGELMFKFAKPLYSKEENIEFYFYTPTNKQYVLNSFDGSLLNFEKTNHIKVKPDTKGVKKFTVHESNSEAKSFYETNVVESGSIKEIFANMRKEYIANSIGAFHATNGVKTDKWLPPSLTNSITGNLSGYMWLKTLNVNTIKGLYGQYEYFFTDGKLDSIIVDHGNLEQDSEVSTRQVFNDVNSLFGDIATETVHEGDNYMLEIDGYMINIYMHNYHVYSKIKKVM